MGAEVPLDHMECARRTIQEIQYITIATICTGTGSHPWNSPVYSAFDSDYNFFWASDHQSQHSKNIRDNPCIFLAIYNSTIPEGTGAGRGVYIQAQARELSDPDQIARAHQLMASRAGKTPRQASHFLGDMPRRIYQATPEKVWVNDVVERDDVRIDVRVEIDLIVLRAEHNPV
ncbi:MAG: pyridoxamine 5'-phosphate oxidase family protein [Pseudonocardiales bacterium]